MPKTIETPESSTKHTFVAEPFNLDFGDGRVVEVRRKDWDVIAFGPTHARGRQIKGFKACLGFFNGLMDIQDGKYPVCEYGLHLKVDPLTFMDLGTLDDVGHMAYDRMPDELQKKYKALKPDGDGLPWHVLNLRYGRLALGREINPLLSEEFTAKFGDDPHQMKIDQNNENWTRQFKQNGLDYALRVVRGFIRVTLVLDPKEGFTGEVLGWEKKINQLTMAADDRAAERIEVVEKNNANKTGKVLAYVIGHNEEVAAEAEQVAPKAEGDDDPEAIIASFIGKNVVYQQGDHTFPGMHCKDRDGVLAAFLTASRMGQNTVVVAVEK